MGQTPAASPLNFMGICDASAAVSLDGDLVAVADDEDNSIRVYSRKQGGAPLFARPLSSFLEVDPKSPESDIEGGTRVGDRIYWISSHGRNTKGKARRSRHQFFGTTGTVVNGKIDLNPIGRPYHGLLADMLLDPKLAQLGLAKAAKLAPKERGGLNIEGLAAATNGHLLIGFRNPIPHGKALVVPLENPSDLTSLGRARFGEPILLDLDGLGIRSITWVQDRFVIVAGRYQGGGQSRLFEWKGGSDSARSIPGIGFAGLNPEAITVMRSYDGADELFVTSDDGTVSVGGQPCKALKSPDQKGFRAISIPLPLPPLSTNK
jgi:hypothetical protein